MSKIRGKNVSTRLTSKYGVTVPLPIRAALKLSPYERVCFKVVPEGILLTKETPECRLCGDKKTLVDTGDFFLCKKCIERIKKINE